MAKVITFSTAFPEYHPKKGQPTYFVEKIWKSIGIIDISTKELDIYRDSYFNSKHLPKHHTIRSGKRFKKGDVFSPRIWKGKPYNSKQITIAPDLIIHDVWDFEIKDNSLYINHKKIDTTQSIDLANNDGLKYQDLLDWFQWPKPFKGQIICWNPKIEY